MHLPHEGVYGRIQISSIHGVGVFAIRDIPKGTDIFAGDSDGMVWVDANDVKNTEAEIKKLYDDFCVIKEGKYGCPPNFNVLTPSWYLNDSKDGANVVCTATYRFIAVRDIKKGEELLSDYSSYNEVS
jgi:uncharacterized protein